MGKFDGILICSDCDGTLTGTDLKIHDKNREAIRYFQSEGGRFTVATGRFPDYFEKFSSDVIPNAPTICCNGGVLYDQNEQKILKTKPFGADPLPITDFILSELKNIKLIYVNGMTEYGNHKHSDKIYLSDGEPYRIVFSQNEDDLVNNFSIVRKKYGDEYSIFPSWNEGIEILPKDVNKAYMLKFIKEIHTDIKKVIAVGDYDNDISMFKAADLSFATENAPERVKNEADYVAPHCNENALAYVIDNINDLLYVQN